MAAGAWPAARVTAGVALFAALCWGIAAANVPIALADAGGGTIARRWFPASHAANADAARALLASGEVAGAAAAARAALRAAPIDQQSLTVLAVSEAPAGLSERMELSAALGWRDRFTQLWLAEAALETRDPELFAQRATAVARQTLQMQAYSGLIDSALADPAMAQALLPHLVPASRWRKLYLASAPAGSAQSLRRAALLQAIGRAGGKMASDEVEPLIARLRHFDADATAYAVWRAHVAAPIFAGHIYDGRFTRIGLEGEVPAFQWHTPTGSTGYVAQEGGATGVLHVHQSQPSAQPLLRQMLELPAGRYRLEWRAVKDAATAAPASDLPFRWKLACMAGQLSGADVVPTTLEPGRFAIDVTVPAGCRRPELALVSSPASDQMEADAFLTRIALTRR